MRVASSDWWASRMVVSVISTFFCASIQSASAFGPCSSRSVRVPGLSASGPMAGTCGAWVSGATGRPATSGLPLTVTSAMNLRSRVARSRRLPNWNSSGVSSMNRVV